MTTSPMELPPKPAGTLAEIHILTPVTVVVPTYQEAENIPHLLDRLEALRQAHGLELELLIMDDRSNDGSVEAVDQSGHDWARIVVRDGPRGLSPAVLDGLRMARHPVVVVMDADLSHPPEKIPDMILALEAGQQLVIGSRYVPGASTDDKWGFFRWLNSQVATLLARPLTSCHDPMAGFFVLRKAELKHARGLNPIGYKIALELIVKCGLENVGEVPIHFADRRYGKSKLTFKEQLRYLQHLRRLYIHRYFNISSAVQYLAVGASGVAVNLAVLTGLVALSVPEPAAIAGGILVSLVSNFALNRRFSFSYARDGSIVKQFLGFVTACSVGIVINYAVSLAILRALPELPVQAAALGGVVAGLGFNYVASRYLVFRARLQHAPPPADIDA